MAEQETKPAADYVPVTLSATPLSAVCRSILVEVAGRVNLTTVAGVVRENVPLHAGYNPLKAAVINAPTSGAAATGVWALY